MSRLFKRLAAGIFILSAIAILLLFSLPLPGTIPVLMYHFLGGPAEAALEGNFVNRESFAKQMAFLKQFHYRVLTMDEYYAIKSGHRKPQGREVLITFDDGQRSFKTDAIPILERYSLPAVIFLFSDAVKSGGVGQYADSLSLKEITELQQNPLLSFQGHTKSHPHLKEITEEQLEEELVVSKNELEAILGKPVNYLAYPFGELNEPIMKAVQKAGYKLAFGTSFKRLEAVPEGPYSLTRVKISESSDTLIVFWYNITGFHQLIKGFRQKIKYGF